jgi:hypothetical protein
MFSYFFHTEPDEYKYTKEELKIIDIMEDIYGSEYDYSKVRYKKYFKITIVCPHHGDFSSSLKILTIGGGCPKCNRRKNLNRVCKHLTI